MALSLVIAKNHHEGRYRAQGGGVSDLSPLVSACLVEGADLLGYCCFPHLVEE